MKIIRILFKAGFLKLSNYPEASLVNTISSVVFIVVQFFVWRSILGSGSTVTYTFTQMFSYILFSQIMTYIYPISIGRQMGSLIKTGEIALFLLKPFSVVKQLVYENLGTSMYRFLFTSIPVFLIGFVISSFKLNHNNILLFLISFILSYIVFLYIDLIFGTFQFYTTNSWGINSLKYAVITLCSGKIIPISLYPLWARGIVEKLPFKYLYDFPLNVIVDLTHECGWDDLIEMVIWVVLLMAVFELLYKVAIRKICIMGG